MDNQGGIIGKDNTATQAVPSSAPWLTPGPAKEAWKRQGNYVDYRAFRASRPAELVITISGPRQFRSV